MNRSVRVRFEPEGVEITVQSGENLLRAAMAAGIFLNAACGGAGVCGKCMVRIVRGDVEIEPHTVSVRRRLRPRYASGL